MNELVFVGTSDAFGAGGRRQSAIVLKMETGNESRTLLLDCAPTTGTGLAALSIPRTAIDGIAVSHFHADHFGGIPQFLLGSNFEDRREHPLEIIGPPDVEHRVRHLSAAMGYNLDRPLSYPLRFREWDTQDPGGLSVAGAQIATFSTRHQPETAPHALSLRWADKHLVYSGDSGWFDELPELVGDADLFVCECTFFDRSFEFHLNYETLRAHRAEFRAQRIVLTHLSEEMVHRRGQLDFECADDGMRLRF